jgi:two-component system sensor histidine kinase HydH
LKSPYDRTDARLDGSAVVLLLCKAVQTILEKALGPEETRSAIAEKRDLLSRLLARLAHEIRNPLSSLAIHAQLLEEDLGVLAPEVRERLSPRLEIIGGELHRLESIVSQFLRLTGPSALEVEPVAPAKVVSQVCDLLRPEAAARDIAFQASVPEDLPHLNADPVRLTQVLLNLLINAMQAVDRSGLIEVSASADERTLSIVVRDTGPGIPVEKLPSIFDPYYTTKPEGHGLGLWIAQQIAVAHGGTLTARNRPDRGAEFILVLPLAPPSTT